MAATLAVMLAVLASLGPIVVLFAASTRSYNFMVFVNTATVGLSGVLGLVFFLRTAGRLTVDPPQNLTNRGTRRVLQAWAVVGGGRMLSSSLPKWFTNPLADRVGLGLGCQAQNSRHRDVDC